MIDGYLNKATKGGGFASLSKKESNELQELSLLVEAYEDQILKKMPLPMTITGVVSDKMVELNINQNGLAQLLGLGNSKLSQILNGKRRPDVLFLKAVHEKLGIDCNFILENIAI